MKRSKSIALSIIPFIVAACGGGSTQEAAEAELKAAKPTHQQVCTDSNRKVVDDSNCRTTASSGSNNGGMNAFLWYYLLFRPGGYPMGYAATGGSFNRPTNAYIAQGRVASTPSISTHPARTSGGLGTTAATAGAGAVAGAAASRAVGS